MKSTTTYICKSCAYESPKWIGKCPSCNNWNTFEEKKNIPKKQQKRMQGIAKKAAPLTFQNTSEQRYKTNISELDNVLGGGFIKDSLVLLSGEPGIGKSTLTLQICEKIASLNKKVLYISGEESPTQISNRASRLGIQNELITIISENSLENIIATLNQEEPDFIIIDSIQVISSESANSLTGSISQVRLATEVLMEFAKKNNKAMLVIGHVTKEGNLAGPRTLEHLVDVVIHLEGERYQNLRLLRGIKNRFGPTSEVGIFEMTQNGLTEVKNPSEKFLEDRKENSIGSILTVTLQGNRPFIIEVQALTNTTVFGYPKRTASGFDVNRLNLLIAVIQKYTGINLTNQDIYVNVIGGIRINEPAADLAVILAILSSYNQKPLPSNYVAIGEVGLSGEIRKTTQMAKRQKEVEKMDLILKSYINSNNIKDLSKIL